MADQAQLESALRKADVAGDTEGARILAAELRRMRTVAPPVVAAPPVPSTGAVAVNAANKGIASLPDMVMNFPAQTNNLARSAYGKATGTEAGYSPPPSFAHRAMTATGMIRPESEPQTGNQRILDTAVQGGVGMAVGPGRSVGNIARNVAEGVAGGAAAGTTTEATGSGKAGMVAGLLTQLGLRTAPKAIYGGSPLNNPVRNETLAQGREQGLIVPPSSVNQSPIVNVLESLAGKDATKQAVQTKNWPKAGAMAAQDIGLPKGTAITEALLDKVRHTEGQPYRDVAAVSPIAKNALDKLIDTRLEAKLAWKEYNGPNHPRSARTDALALEDMAKTYEQVIDTEAIKTGRRDLLPALKEARTNIAKTYDVEHALNIGDAGVSGRDVGRQLDKGKPLSGNLKTLGKFAEAFPEAVVDHPKAAGVSYTNTIASALLGGAGGSQFGLKGAVAGAAAPWLRGGLRSALLSGPGQRILAQPGRSSINVGDTALRSALLARAVAERNQGGQ